MERFSQCPHISQAMLRKANAVRIYLRVVTIADLADVGGTFIPAGMLTGKWQAGSDLKWPYQQPLPLATFWSTFRRCLWLMFSTNTPPYHHTITHPTHSILTVVWGNGLRYQGTRGLRLSIGDHGDSEE